MPVVVFYRLQAQTEEKGERELSASLICSLILWKYYLLIYYFCACTRACTCSQVHACHRCCVVVKGQLC